MLHAAQRFCWHFFELEDVVKLKVELPVFGLVLTLVGNKLFLDSLPEPLLLFQHELPHLSPLI